MILATDYLSKIKRKANKVNPNVTIKAVNREFVDKVASVKGTNRSDVIDQILDAAREQYESAVASEEIGA